MPDISSTGFLGFFIKKPVLQSCQTLEILGVEIHSKDMILTLPEEKNSKIVKSSITFRELAQVISCLTLTVIAVLSAPLQYRSMQCQLIIEFSTERDYNSQKKTNEERECRAELMGLKNPLKHRKNTNTRSNQFERLGCLLSGWQKTGGLWTLLEKKEHKNVL